MGEIKFFSNPLWRIADSCKGQIIGSVGVAGGGSPENDDALSLAAVIPASGSRNNNLNIEYEKKKFSALLLLLSVLTFAQKKKHQLSSHILDVSKGVPAAGVTIRLEKYSEQTKEWTFAVKKLRHLKFRSLR